jgi:hypothetical protein
MHVMWCECTSDFYVCSLLASRLCPTVPLCNLRAFCYCNWQATVITISTATSIICTATNTVSDTILLESFGSIPFCIDETLCISTMTVWHSSLPSQIRVYLHVYLLKRCVRPSLYWYVGYYFTIPRTTITTANTFNTNNNNADVKVH